MGRKTARRDPKGRIDDEPKPNPSNKQEPPDGESSRSLLWKGVLTKSQNVKRYQNLSRTRQTARDRRKRERNDNTHLFLLRN
jgi:hypothetical protein